MSGADFILALLIIPILSLILVGGILFKIIWYFWGTYIIIGLVAWIAYKAISNRRKLKQSKTLNA